jgi:hypothetical protein
MRAPWSNHDEAPVQGRHAGRSRRMIVLLLATLVALILVAQTKPGEAALRATGLAPNARSFSELYFLNSAALQPRIIVHASDALEVQFVVHRVGVTPASFHWQINQSIGRDASSLDTGKIVVPAGESVLVSTTVRLSCVRRRRVRLGVDLVGTSLHIDQWLVCRPRR